MKNQRKRGLAVRQSMTVVGVFDDRLLADQAVSELCKVGFVGKQIGVVPPRYGRDSGRDTEIEQAIPSLCPAVSAGTFGVSLSSAVAGTGIVGLVGALLRAGVPEHEARYYRDEFEAGRTLVTVAAGSRSGQAKSILRRHGSYDMLSGILSREVS